MSGQAANGGAKWTAEEDAAIIGAYRWKWRADLPALAMRIGRTLNAVYGRACYLGIAAPRRPVPRAHYAALVAEEAERAGLDPLRVDSWRQSRPYVLARRRVWRRLRAEGYSYPAIGKAAEASHSTVFCAVRADDGVMPRRVALPPLMAPAGVRGHEVHAMRREFANSVGA